MVPPKTKVHKLMYHQSNSVKSNVQCESQNAQPQLKEHRRTQISRGRAIDTVKACVVRTCYQKSVLPTGHIYGLVGGVSSIVSMIENNIRWRVSMYSLESNDWTLNDQIHLMT